MSNPYDRARRTNEWFAAYRKTVSEISIVAQGAEGARQLYLDGVISADELGRRLGIVFAAEQDK